MKPGTDRGVKSALSAAGSRRLNRIGSVIVTIGCLAILLKVVDFRHLVALMASADPIFLVSAVLLRAADRLVMIAKWFPLLRVQVPRVTFATAARAYLASGLAHYALPFSIGADVLRAATLGRNERAIHGVSASIIAEKLLGLASTGVLCLVSLVVALRSSINLTFLFPWAVLAISMGMAALFAPLASRIADPLSRWLGRVRHFRPAGFLERLAIAYSAYRSHKGILVRVGLISVAEQLFPVIVAGTVALSLELPITLEMLIVAVPLSLFAARLPISIGGIGVAEGSMAYLLGLFGIPLEQALALSLLTRGVDVVVVTVPGVFLWKYLGSSPSEFDAGAGEEDGAGLAASEPATF